MRFDLRFQAFAADDIIDNVLCAYNSCAMRAPTAFVQPLPIKRQRRCLHVPPIAPFQPQHYGFTSPSSMAPTALPSMLASIIAPHASPGFFRLTLAFLAGGLFFSSILAIVASVAAIGRSNLQRVRQILRLVIRSVWNAFSGGFSDARKTLRKDGKWQWRDASRVLRDNWSATRRIAAEGVQAIRMERSMYFAAVGAPGLIPIQYAIDRLLPFSIATQMKQALEDTLDQVSNPNVRRLVLQEFDAGTIPPLLQAARVYDLGKEALAFDIDFVWRSNLTAKILVITKRFGFKVPVTIKDVRFAGTVRVQLTPLTKTPPGYGAALVSFPSVPEIGLNVNVAGGEVTKVPWLRDELLAGIEKSIESELLWPKRNVIPSKTFIAGGRFILDRSDLEELTEHDPFLEAESKKGETPILKEYVESIQPDRSSLPGLLEVFVGDREQVFDSISHGTGSISKKEFMSAAENTSKIEKFVSRMKHGLNTSLNGLLTAFVNDKEKIFDQMDEDGDGEISKKEFMEVTEEMKEQLESEVITEKEIEQTAPKGLRQRWMQRFGR